MGTDKAVIRLPSLSRSSTAQRKIVCSLGPSPRPPVRSVHPTVGAVAVQVSLEGA